MPLIVLPSSPVGAGTLRYYWIDRNGITRDLSGQTSPRLFVDAGEHGRGGPIGLGAPPVRIAEQKLPWASGGVVRHIGTSPAVMTIPITIVESTFSAVVGAVDDLRDWFYTGDEMERQPGYFGVIREDNSVRERLCYYTGGLEGDFSRGGPHDISYAIELYAPDGYPTDGEDQLVIWDTSDFPNVAVINAGERDAFPIWTITGPAQGVVIENVTNGAKVWGWGGVVPAGQTLLVDTRPASQRVTYPVTFGSGISQYLYMTANSELWWLLPGVNALTITIIAQATAATRVQLQYRQRYRGMLL